VVSQEEYDDWVAEQQAAQGDGGGQLLGEGTGS
jgi:heme/copper-type cytochrome/quinol oxidase subunit 2